MNTPSKCPDPVRWHELLDSRLAEPEATDLSVHLESCADCQSRLDRLTAGEANWTDAPRTLEQRVRPALRRAMEHLKAQGQAALDTVGPTTIPNAEIPFLHPSADPAYIGRLGSYEVLGVIGRGGMGVVLKAFDPALQRLTAIKVLAPQWASQSEARQRFKREGRAAAQVRHENVIAIHAVEEVDDLPYLVMEYVPGMSLQQRLDRDGPLDLEEILRIGAQAAAGLAAAHQQGLIHRDIKPANILLDSDGNARLTDFGLARAVDDTSLTQTGVIAGTPQYMAPEQARGTALDHRADLFSLGSVLYALCTGEAPFRAPSTLAVLKRVCDEQPRDVCDLNPDVPDWLAEIIDKLHEKRPRDRFQSTDDVACLLNQHLGHLRSPDTVDKPPRLKRAPSGLLHYWWAAALAIVAAASLPLIVWAVVVIIRLPDRDRQEQQGQAPHVRPEVPKAEQDPLFQRIRAELDDANVITCRDALQRLATMQPNDQRDEVAKKLVKLTEIDSPHIRRPAVFALGVWGSATEMPALLKAMEHSDVFTRREALKVIGRFRDPQTVAPVIRCFRDFQTRADADKALCELGTMAEGEVLMLLKEQDVFLKRDAMKVLALIGTQASVPALQAAAADNSIHSFHWRAAAQEALAAIAARKKQ